MIKNIKGTKDILPDETQLWQFIEKKIHLFFLTVDMEKFYCDD